MTLLGWLAAIVLFVQLPIPLLRFVMHPKINYWRYHRSAGYATALLLAWAPVTLFLMMFRRELFLHAWPPMWGAVVGFTFLFLEVWIFWRVKRDLGESRLIGQTELSGGGEVARQGIYARTRHRDGAHPGSNLHGGRRAVDPFWCRVRGLLPPGAALRAHEHQTTRGLATCFVCQSHRRAVALRRKLGVRRLASAFPARARLACIKVSKAHGSDCERNSEKSTAKSFTGGETCID